METKYTPGPWKFTQHEEGFPNFGHIHHDWKNNGRNWTRTIAVLPTYAGKDECRANAQLIAAAPELFEACRAAKATLALKYEKEHQFNDINSQRLFEMLNAVIAKAIGE